MRTIEDMVTVRQVYPVRTEHHLIFRFTAVASNTKKHRKIKIKTAIAMGISRDSSRTIILTVDGKKLPTNIRSNPVAREDGCDIVKLVHCRDDIIYSYSLIKIS